MVACRGCESSARHIADLEEELKESQQDKDFVKTLWRQVQSDNGDVGAIVNTVLERLSKQNEEKDRSVLQILQEKDSEISALKNEVSWLNNTLDLEKKDKECLQQNWTEKEDDLNELISQLEEQIAVNNLALSDPIRQSREVLVKKLDHNKSDLERQLQTMQKDLKSCGTQMSFLKKHHEEQVTENERLHSLLQSRDTELESHKLILSELKVNLADRKDDVAVLRQKLEFADVGTSKALRAFERSEKSLRATQQDVLEKERVQHEKEKQHLNSMDQLHSTVSQLEDKVAILVHEEQTMRCEYDKLKSSACGECLKLKETLLARDSDVSEKDKYLTLVDQVKDRCVKYLNRPLAFRDIPDVIDIILADVTGSNGDLKRCGKLIKQLQINCQEKDLARGKLQEVHDNRLERMTTLQEYLSEVLDELKILDKDRWKVLHCDFRETDHAPQPLRHEDSTTVWVDLQHYKGLCSKIKRELQNVEDENDKLKLQRVSDINTFNEMKAAILIDQQECERKLRVASHQTVCGCNLQLEILRDKIEELSEHSEQLNSENIKLMSALQAEEAKVVERRHCDLIDGTTQTSDTQRTAVATSTDTVLQVRQSDAANFQSTLALLDKLTLQNQENIPPQNLQMPPKTPTKSKKVRSTCTKTMGTQTISHPPIKVLQKPPAAMKIRMASLNQQVAVLTKAKQRHAKDMAEEEAKIEQLEKQLSTTLRQVSASQNLVAGLNEDVRCGHEDALALRDQIQELQSSGLRQSELATLQDKALEIKKLNHQNYLLTTQVNSNNSTVSKLKGEVEERAETIMKLEDKVSRSERQVRQQRVDTEQLRQEVSKYKASKTEVLVKLEETVKKLNKMQDLADNRKKYIETLKAQLSNAKVNIEQAKGHYEDYKVALDTKTRELKNVARKHDANDKMVADLQALASRQLEDQGKQFAAFEEKLQKKVNVLSKRNMEWEKCIKQAIGKIVEKIKQEKDKRVVASSLSSDEYDRAKHLSSSILQLSEADFHDIMSSTKVSHTKDSGCITEVWKNQLVKILSLDDFGPVLANSLDQLFDEFAKVISGELSNSARSCSIVSGSSGDDTSTKIRLSSGDDTPTKIRLNSGT